MPPEKRPSDRPGEFRKRQKVSLACEQCRTRKSKCDGLKPVCGECAQRGNRPGHCRYRLHDHRDAEHDQYVQSLLARIRQLEQSTGNVKPSVSSAGLSQAAHFGAQTPQTLGQYSSHEAISSVSAQTPIPQDLMETESSPVDGMGATQTTHPEVQESHGRYYGSSSAASFMQEVYKTIWTNSTPASRTTVPTHTASARESENFWALKTLDRLSLLPRPLTDSALNCYWDQVYHLYPFVHKPTFMRAYEQLWMSQPSGDDLNAPEAGLGGSKAYGPRSIVFHCALNTMLALATQFMDISSDERQRLSLVFSNKARSLCQLDLFDDGSLAVIQTMLLMTQVLQATPFPNRCWNCIGIACRLAQGFGMHLETGSRGTSLEIEMRRRVWHGCVVLDAVVSMTLGRPLMLYQYGDIPNPGGVDDEYLTDKNDQPQDQLSRIQFFVETVKLYKLMADVVTHLYHRSGESEDASGKSIITGSIDFILETDKKISAFEDQVPAQLHWDKRKCLPTDVRTAAPFEQQSSVLYVRYLYLKVLLYRAVFTRYCQTTSALDHSEPKPHYCVEEAEDLSLTIARSLSIACVRYAAQLIEQVYKRSITKNTGAWWYNLFYLRVAGIVVLLAMISRRISDAVGQNCLDDAWHSCQQALTALEKFSATADRCLSGLRKLHTHILEYNRQQADWKSESALDASHGAETAGQKLDGQGFEDAQPDFYAFAAASNGRGVVIILDGRTISTLLLLRTSLLMMSDRASVATNCPEWSM